MPKLALYVPLKAKPGKERDVADFLTSALPLPAVGGLVLSPGRGPTSVRPCPPGPAALGRLSG